MQKNVMLFLIKKAPPRIQVYYFSRFILFALMANDSLPL